MNISSIITEGFKGMIQGDLHAEHEPFGERGPVFMALTDTKGVLSYVIEDKDAQPNDFWKTTGWIGTFIDEQGEQISAESPKEGDVAFSVEKRTENGLVSFVVSESGPLIGTGSVGIYYPPSEDQNAFRKGADREAFIQSANQHLEAFAHFVNGPVCTIVQETWELGEDGAATRTKTQMTSACDDYESAWLMIEDDHETRFEDVGLEPM